MLAQKIQNHNFSTDRSNISRAGTKHQQNSESWLPRGPLASDVAGVNAHKSEDIVIVLQVYKLSLYRLELTSFAFFITPQGNMSNFYKTRGKFIRTSSHLELGSRSTTRNPKDRRTILPIR